ncbi:MAG: hypothetical protein LGB58_00645, partial [Sulfurovum sp.]|nr:hypothetical protein [Sulfurovum sp.]
DSNNTQTKEKAGNESPDGKGWEGGRGEADTAQTNETNMRGNTNSSSQEGRVCVCVLLLLLLFACLLLFCFEF